MIGIGHMFGGGDIFALFLLPTLVIAAAVVFMSVARRPTHAHTRCPNVDGSVEVVRQRFARGEIDAREYNRVVSALIRTQ